ncbi:MAG: cytochrome c peroxidase [Bacteroidota bacterium]
MRYGRYYLGALALAMLMAACSAAVDTPPAPLVTIPKGFPELPVPPGNQLTAARIALGKKLFYDKQLSRTGEIACGSCHLQEKAFADPNQFSIGVEGRTGSRNAPSLANMAYNSSYFWDGGVPTLEQQAIGPIINPLEMNMTLGEATARVAAVPEYVTMFRSAYDTLPSPGTLTRAIASFVRTLVSGNSRFDKFDGGDSSAMTVQEQHGMTIFFGEKGECFHCHIGFNFSNNTFKNDGFLGKSIDSGRAKVTENPADMGKFKVPTLRNIALTAPYMHDGSLATLEEVVEHYVTLNHAHPNLDPVMHPLNLTDQDRADLVAFLKALTDDSFINDPRFKP